MRTVRFHNYGEPADVLQLDTVAIPEAGGARIRVRVHACGLNPAGWAYAGVCSQASFLEESGWRSPAPSTSLARA